MKHHAMRQLLRIEVSKTVYNFFNYSRDRLSDGCDGGDGGDWRSIWHTFDDIKCYVDRNISKEVLLMNYNEFSKFVCNPAPASKTVAMLTTDGAVQGAYGKQKVHDQLYLLMAMGLLKVELVQANKVDSMFVYKWI